MGLFKNELYKLFHTRTPALFSGILVLFMAFNVLGYEPGGNPSTIWTFSYGQSLPIALTEIYTQLMAFMIPIYVAGSFASEYTQGTLKLSLLRPVSRMQLLKAKCASLLVLISVLTLIAVIAGYALGIYQLGWGAGFEYGGKLYSTGQGIFMTLLAYLCLIPPCAAYGLLAVCIALVSGDMAATIIASLSISIIGFNLNTVSAIASYSLSYHMAYLYKFFIPKPDLPGGLIALLMLLLYLGIFAVVSILLFKKKDIVH